MAHRLVDALHCLHALGRHRMRTQKVQVVGIGTDAPQRRQRVAHAAGVAVDFRHRQYRLAVGRAYTWDTNRPHRVFCRGGTTATRIHLVLGIAPWFDHDPAEGWAEGYGQWGAQLEASGVREPDAMLMHASNLQALRRR